MKRSIGNKKKFYILMSGTVLCLVLALAFLAPAKKNDGAGKALDPEIEGVNLTYLAFNKNNEKKLELKCVESQRGADDKLLMKKITATIFKADKLDKDVHISADAGTVKNDFNDFYLQGNAVIASPSFTLSSSSFNLKDLDVLSTQDAVDFKLRDAAGQGRKGLLYIFQSKYLKLFQPRGVLTRDGKPYHFQSQVLRVINQKDILHFDKDAQLDGGGTTVRGNRISLQYDQDFINLQWAVTVGNGYFQTSEIGKDGKKHGREITANQIKMLNDPQGRLQEIAVLGDGKITIVDPKNTGEIQSGNIQISLDSETQVLKTIQTLARGSLESKGRDNIRIKADSLLATYGKDGALARIQAEGSCEFGTDDFSGTAARLDYDAANFRVGIFGKDAAITSGKNTFHSSQFLIQTRLRRLSSDKGVKARLLPEKKNVLLRAKPVFITAAGMEMSEKGKVTGFKGKVNLFQDEIELQSGELLFDTRSNRIACRGDADLKFVSDNEPVVLHGQTMVFQAGELKIVLEGDGRLKQAENLLAARKIELAFNRSDKLENITAADQVAFSKKDLSGKAQQLFWYFSKKTILFRNAAEITKKDAGTTRGQELRFNLNTNEIEVTSADDRSETIIRQEAP